MPGQSPTALEKMRNAIQLAGIHYIVCMKARPTNADRRLKIGSMEYVFETIQRVSDDLLHAEFQRWAARTILRDIIEDFSVFLTEVYRNTIHAHPRPTYSVTLDRFERMGIEDQLLTLSNNFAISPEWTSRLVGYNRARNCLAHRQGIVCPRDVTDGNDLVVRWLAAKVEVVGGTPSPTIEVSGPMGSLVGMQHIHGAAARAELQDKEKRFAVGSALHLSPADIFEIVGTFQLVAAVFSNLSPRN